MKKISIEVRIIKISSDDLILKTQKTQNIAISQIEVANYNDLLDWHEVDNRNIW